MTLLKDRVVLVSGGTQGLGAGIARAVFAEFGRVDSLVNAAGLTRNIGPRPASTSSASASSSSESPIGSSFIPPSMYDVP